MDAILDHFGLSVADTVRHATISYCGRYRYGLLRTWARGQRVAFVGLNPSTADAIHDDPTIRRCRAFAQAWGYGGMVMLNLFAYRATSPRDMMAADFPVGPSNDYYLRRWARVVDLVVVCWGSHGGHMGRDREVVGMLSGLHCLTITKGGQPGHPLYLRGDLQPIPYENR